MIDSQASQILERWEACAAKAASARGLTHPELMNIMPLYLASLAQLDGPDLDSRQLELVQSHLSSRLRHGYDLPELQNEFTLLGRCIFRAWAALPSEERPEAEDVDGILETVHRAVVLLSDMFVRHLLDDAQSEKRFFRLIRQAFTEFPSSPSGTRPSVPDRLRAAMPIVMEALEAATAGPSPRRAWPPRCSDERRMRRGQSTGRR